MPLLEHVHVGTNKRHIPCKWTKLGRPCIGARATSLTLKVYVVPSNKQI